MYKVAVDFAPAYELATSLAAYLDHKQYKHLEMPSDWARQVARRFSAPFAQQLAGVEGASLWPRIALLIWQCPDKANFLAWYGARSPGELYDLLASQSRHLPADLGAQRDADVAMLTAWSEQYFSSVDPRVVIGLAANAETMAARVEQSSPPDLVEEATMGMWVEPEPPIEQVLLVPQHHFRPWTIPVHFRSMRIYGYPADVLPPPPGEPSPGLLRLTRALADESRLKILRFLAGEKRTFTDVLHFSGLTKGTVNHHLVALRAAGLVRIHDAPGLNRSYSLRPGALSGVGARLEQFALDQI